MDASGRPLNLVVSAARRRQTVERTVERLSEPDDLPSTEEAVIRRERDTELVRTLGKSPLTRGRRMPVARSRVADT